MNRAPAHPAPSTATGTNAEQIGGSGRWLVRTQTALYEVDLDGARVIRWPDSQPSVAPDRDVPPVAVLRRDSTGINLRSVHRCVVGEPMILLLDLRGDGILTIRCTTAVLWIQPAEGSREDS